ncbi:MAG: metal ABC transporter permease [Treponema sp.]|nr:metal ABC transporter permease [Treponema sp.]
MTQILESLKLYFSFSFVQYAFIAGVMIAAASSLLGVILVLKRFSYIGDGLSHTAFGAMAIASILKITSATTLFILPLTIICAIIILCSNENSKIKGDASVAMISVGALALGYFLMNIFSPPANLSGDVCSTLFGSALILTLTKGDMLLSVIISLLVIIFFILFYNRIFAITFDEDFSFASGTNTKLMNVFMASLIAVIIVLAMNLVGTLLISALIIFPAVSSMLIFKSFKKVTIFACCISVFCAVTGLLASILAGTPVGSTIVISDIAAFLICKLLSLILKR